MYYVLLIYGSEAASAEMTQEERDALMQAHAVFAHETQQRGLLTGGNALQPTRTATTVRVHNGKTLITDGPFAETKEQLVVCLITWLLRTLADAKGGMLKVLPHGLKDEEAIKV